MSSIITDETGKAIAEAINQSELTKARISEINNEAENIKNKAIEQINQTKDTIPENYTELVAKVNGIRSDLELANEDLKEKLEVEYEILSPINIREECYLDTNGQCVTTTSLVSNVYIYDVKEGDRINGIFFSDYTNAFYALYSDNILKEVSDNLKNAGGYAVKDFVIGEGINKLYVYTYKRSGNYVSYCTVRRYKYVRKTCEDMPENGIPKAMKEITNFVSGDVYQYEKGSPLLKNSSYQQSGICIPVKSGETYVINGWNNYPWFLYYLVDNKQNVIPFNYNNESKKYENVIIRIPDDAVSLYVNSSDGTPTELYKVTEWQLGNNITGKTLVFDGDSICESRTSSGQTENGGAYPKLIADKNYATYNNYATSDSILVSASDTKSSSRSIVDSIINLPLNGDLYCFEGGLNDYWENQTLGDYSPNDYTSKLNTGTVCGALEYIFKYSLTHFTGKAICFVIPHKVQDIFYTPNTKGDTWKDYHDKFVGICNKYSIPYYDAYLYSGLNGWNEIQSNAYLTAGQNATKTKGDGIHPNKEGYKRYYVGQLTDLFDKIMRVN